MRHSPPLQIPSIVAASRGESLTARTSRRWAAVAVLAAAGVLGLAACSDDPPGARRSAETTLPAERPAREDGDIEREVGDPAEVFRLTATVVEVGRTEEYSEVAKDGYLWAKVKIENTTGGGSEYHRLDWQLVKPDGSVVNRAVVPGEAQLGGGELEAGEVVEGQLIFSVGDTEGTFELVYLPRHQRIDPIERQRGIWVFDSAPSA